jgi:DNA helicase-2/ATP-dependent DNA helicase PcrA
MSFSFSKYQIAIFDFIRQGIGNAIINAVAGSGKTSTIIEGLKLCVGQVLFLAFNKSIADELQRRVPANVKASTLHSAGLSLITSRRKVKINQYKIDSIMDNYHPLMIEKQMKGQEKSERYECRKIVKQMVGLIKNCLIDYNDLNALRDLAMYYDIDLESKHHAMIKYVIERSNVIDEYEIDFDDMIYIPVLYKLMPKRAYDFIFVDECQDLNRTQIELVLLLSSGGRVICVGDPKQSIYGFRGADVGAMEKIKTALNAVEFPLSVCYRCGSKILDMAREIVPQIEAKPEAIEGEIVTIDENKFVDTLTKDNPADVLTICRVNAEIVKYALGLIAKGFKAIIKGRDIGQGLISLVKKLNADSIADLNWKLDQWRTKEIDKMENRKNAESAKQHIEDKYQTLMAVSADCDSVYCIINKLENLFRDDSVVGYIFSTVHKAKGLEAKTVYILAPSKLPLVWKDQQAWEVEQEMNIKYVAITRAKEKLIFVKGKKD